MKLMTLSECYKSIDDSEGNLDLRGLEFIKKGKNCYLSCTLTELPEVMALFISTYLNKLKVKSFINRKLATQYTVLPQKFVSSCIDAANKQNTHLVKLTDINYQVNPNKTCCTQVKPDMSFYFQIEIFARPDLSTHACSLKYEKGLMAVILPALSGEAS